MRVTHPRPRLLPRPLTIAVIANLAATIPTVVVPDLLLGPAVMNGSGSRWAPTQPLGALGDYVRTATGEPGRNVLATDTP